MKYKTFGELSVGDNIYGIEVTWNECKFKKFKIKNIDETISNNEVIETYIDKSPLSFDFPRNDSSWHGFIFTTEKEAKREAKKLINKTIKELGRKLISHSKTLTKIETDDIKFR